MRTVNDYVGALCTVLRFAYRSGFIRDKPYEDVKKLKRSNTKPDPLLRDEYDQLVMALDGQRRFMWTIAIFTGLRHGELAALAWEDIDLDKGELRVSRNLTSTGRIRAAKNAGRFSHGNATRAGGGGTTRAAAAYRPASANRDHVSSPRIRQHRTPTPALCVRPAPIQRRTAAALWPVVDRRSLECRCEARRYSTT